MSRCANKGMIKPDFMSMNLCLESSTTLINLDNLDNLQVHIELSHKSRVDFVASKHALPIILLKDLIDEVKWGDHDILSHNSSLHHNGLFLLALAATISIFVLLCWLDISVKQNKTKQNKYTQNMHQLSKQLDSICTSEIV